MYILYDYIYESNVFTYYRRIGDVLKKKRQNKKGRFSRLAGTTTPQQTQQPESLFTGFTPKNNRFLGNLNPAKWGRKSSSSSTSGDKRDSSSSTNLSKPPSNPSLTGGNRDKAKTWVREQAAQFLARYQDDAPCTHPALTVLARLTAAIQRLQSNVNILYKIYILYRYINVLTFYVSCVLVTIIYTHYFNLCISINLYNLHLNNLLFAGIGRNVISVNGITGYSSRK